MAVGHGIELGGKGREAGGGSRGRGGEITTGRFRPEVPGRSLSAAKPPGRVGGRSSCNGAAYAVRDTVDGLGNKEDVAPCRRADGSGWWRLDEGDRGEEQHEGSQRKLKRANTEIEIEGPRPLRASPRRRRYCRG